MFKKNNSKQKINFPNSIVLHFKGKYELMKEHIPVHVNLARDVCSVEHNVSTHYQ